MRVKVRFRYNAATGEVETFVVEDLGGDQRATDHDARHDRVTADIARVIERNALIEELLPGAEYGGSEADRSPFRSRQPEPERERGPEEELR